MASQDAGHKLQCDRLVFGLRGQKYQRAECQGARLGGVQGLPADSGPDEDGDGVPVSVLAQCKNTIETIPTLTVSSTNVEDLDTDGLDHTADAIRYLLMFIQSPFLRKSGRLA